LPVRIYDGVDQLTGAMTYHRDRHSVLAGNVANLDTPGYRPADLERQLGTAPAGGLAVTNSAHISSPNAGGAAAEGRLVIDAGGALAGPDGNAVQLERELAKIDANRVRYATSAELVSRRLAMLRYAAGDGT
jgi:flagellar basal-body rod protein FlgB